MEVYEIARDSLLLYTAGVFVAGFFFGWVTSRVWEGTEHVQSSDREL